MASALPTSYGSHSSYGSHDSCDSTGAPVVEGTPASPPEAHTGAQLAVVVGPTTPRHPHSIAARFEVARAARAEVQGLLRGDPVLDRLGTFDRGHVVIAPATVGLDEETWAHTYRHLRAVAALARRGQAHVHRHGAWETHIPAQGA